MSLMRALPSRKTELAVTTPMGDAELDTTVDAACP